MRSWLLGADTAAKVGRAECSRNLIRATLVVAVCGLATAVPAFLSMVSLVSGVALTTTALVFPLACHLKTAELTRCGQCVHVVALLLGVGIAVLTTAEAILKLRG